MVSNENKSFSETQGPQTGGQCYLRSLVYNAIVELPAREQGTFYVSGKMDLHANDGLTDQPTGR